MNTPMHHLVAATRALKKKTLNMIINDGRVTPHGLNILDRWSQEEPWEVKRLARNPAALMAVLLRQQEWETPFTAAMIDEQLRNGLTRHEVRELGAPDLSCRHAVWRMSLSTG